MLPGRQRLPAGVVSQSRVDVAISPLTPHESTTSEEAFPGEASAFEGSLLSDVVDFCIRFDAVRRRGREQVVGEELLGSAADASSAVLRQQQDPDLDHALRPRGREQTPAGEAGEGPVRKRDREDRVFGAEVAVLFPASPAGVRISVAAPLERLADLRIDVEAGEGIKVAFLERPQMDLDPVACHRAPSCSASASRWDPPSGLTMHQTPGSEHGSHPAHE